VRGKRARRQLRASLYATTVTTASTAMTKITIKSSTIVKPAPALAPFRPS